MWSRDLAKQVGVVLPLFACEHYYVVSEPVSGLPSSLPIMRDLDHGVYFKEDPASFSSLFRRQREPAADVQGAGRFQLWRVAL